MKTKLVIIFLFNFLILKSQTLESVRPKFINVLEINNEIKKVESVGYDLTRCLPKDYVENGKVDYTVYLQKGLNNYKNIIMPNFPILINQKGLTLKSNHNIVFQKNSKLILKSNNQSSYEILRVHNISNVNIFNAKIVGDRLTHLISEGEWGMGIAIRSSNNIGVYNCEISSCWGDGIYIGATTGKVNGKNKLLNPSSAIKIFNTWVDNNLRNGISIVSVKGLEIHNSLASRNDGVFPKSGIDIEPSNFAEDVFINNIVTFKNGVRGIDIYLKSIAKSTRNRVSVNIDNHTDYFSPIAVRVAEYKGLTSKNGASVIAGFISINNAKWFNNAYSPLVIETNQQFAPSITFSNIYSESNSGLKHSNSSFKNVGQVRKGLSSTKNIKFN